MRVEIKVLDEEIFSLLEIYGVNEDADKDEKDNYLELFVRKWTGETGQVENQNIGLEIVLGREAEETKMIMAENNNRIMADDLMIAKHKHTRIRVRRDENFITDYFIVVRNKWRVVKDVKVIRQAEMRCDNYLLNVEVKEEMKTKEVNEKRELRKDNQSQNERTAM